MLLQYNLPDPAELVPKSHIDVAKGVKQNLDDHSRLHQTREPQLHQPHHVSSIRPKVDINIWLAGIILDATKIRISIWETLLQLNCEYNVNIHIISKENSDLAKTSFLNMITAKYQHSACSSIDIISQAEALDNLVFPIITEEELSLKKNRIDRISILRDVQRTLLHMKYSNNSSADTIQYSSSDNTRTARTSNNDGNDDNGVVILADLDLLELPKVELLMEQVNKLMMMQQQKMGSPNDEQKQLLGSSSSYPHNAICASGVTMNLGSKKKKRQHDDSNTAITDTRKKDPSYYDTFATVFYPDTFSHPLKRRLIPKYYYGENTNLVRSNNQRGRFTQRRIYNYLKHEGMNAKTGNVRVTSCFGGLAMYKSSAYFQPNCQYRLGGEDYVNAMVDEAKQNWNDDDHDDNDYDDSNDDDDDDDDDNAQEGTAGYNTTSIMRYANSQEERPCEHVVFHDCLKKNLIEFDIAINPNLVSFWEKDS